MDLEFMASAPILSPVCVWDHAFLMVDHIPCITSSSCTLWKRVTEAKQAVARIIEGGYVPASRATKPLK